MTPSPLKKLFRPFGVSLALLLAVALVIVNVPHAQAQNAYVDKVNAALPAGTTVQTASTSQLVKAVSDVVAANPANAAAIAGAVTAAAGMDKANPIADGIGKLFAFNPALIPSAPGIAREIAISVDAKSSSLESRATQIGHAASSLIHRIDPSKAENRDVIIDLVKQVLSVNPRINFSNIVIGVILDTLKALGFPDDFWVQLQNGIREVITDPDVLAQVLDTFDTVLLQTSPYIPGEILPQETPVSND